MEGLLDKIILQGVSESDHINYGYFIGKNRNSVYKLKSALYDSQLNPLILKDADHENALFAKVLNSELDGFLKIIKEFNFKKVKLNRHNIEEVKWMFGDGWPSK